MYIDDTVYRSKDGYKVEIDKDTAAKDEEKAEKDANFKIMKEGFVQASMHQEKVENFVKESQKGLARYVGDESMNEFLKSKQLVDDPLIKMKRKKAKSKFSLSTRPNFNCFPFQRIDLKRDVSLHTKETSLATVSTSDLGIDGTG